MIDNIPIMDLHGVYQPTNITGGHHLVEISRVMVMVCEKMTGLRFHPRKEFISKS